MEGARLAGQQGSGVDIRVTEMVGDQVIADEYFPGSTTTQENTARDRLAAGGFGRRIKNMLHQLGRRTHGDDR